MTHEMSVVAGAESARITVSRHSPQDAGFREVYVSIDGEQVAVLDAGGEVTRQVPVGHHRLSAHNTMNFRTHDVELEPGQHLRFHVANRAGWSTYALMAIFGAGPVYLTFEPG